MTDQTEPAVQVQGMEHLDITEDDVRAEIIGGGVITDACARVIAARYHSPGTRGRAFSQLSHGLVATVEDLRADIDYSLVHDVEEEEHRSELLSLARWLESKARQATPTMSAVTRRDVAEALYNYRWGPDNTEFAGERMDGAEDEADAILNAIRGQYIATYEVTEPYTLHMLAKDTFTDGRKLTLAVDQQGNMRLIPVGRSASPVMAQLVEKAHLRIEVVGYRDPDASTDIAVFVDGKPFNAEVLIVDPGAGHELSTWRESRDEHAAAASPAASELIRQNYDAGEETDGVEGEDEDSGYGICLTCSAPCDASGCTANPDHLAAVDLPLTATSLAEDVPDEDR